MPSKFEASLCWLTRYQERNNLSLKTEIGECICRPKFCIEAKIRVKGSYERLSSG